MLFDNLDVEYLHNLNLHLPSPLNVDYDNIMTKKYMVQFRERYKADPSKYGLLGFDVAYYYLNALRAYGTRFQSKLPMIKYNALAASFDYFKTGLESGYENRAVHILKYQDFKLIKVN